MVLQTITNINVDFYDKKYILINAKQLDKNSRFLLVTCYNHGELFTINSRDHVAYIRYKKSDEHSVFNFCEITKDGKVLVEFTEQMLASSGICQADVVIVNKGKAEVNPDTGEIVNIDKASVLSTMTFYIDVSETAVDNAQIESSYEYSAFNQSLETYWANFEEVMQTSKSYAVGNAGGIRPDEDTDNAKYYYELTLGKTNETLASAEAAALSAKDASDSASNAKTSETNAKDSEEKAKQSEINAKTSETNAKNSEINASNSATSAQNSMTDASNSASSASVSAKEAQTYYTQTEAIVHGLNGAFRPKGTITFEELIALKENETIAIGDLYNISNNFTTNDSFRMGAGVSYDAGTNVYYTADGKFDCLTGTTVTGVKGSQESVYRKGNVELSAENVGAIPTTDIATVNEIKEFLGI